MHINGNGDAEGNFTVIALHDDPKDGATMVPVGYFGFTDRKAVYVKIIFVLFIFKWSLILDKFR